MDKNSFVDQTRNYVINSLVGRSADHDFWHAYRVWKLARHITNEESADLLVVELAALLHDINDRKFITNNHDEKNINVFLLSIGVSNNIIKQINKVIETTSFKGANVLDTAISIEAKIVQDADRLDAMGAIGIGRTFAYGGFIGRTLHNPLMSPVLHNSYEDYKNCNNSTINHFYEKLLLLKDRMQTKTGKLLAEKKHRLMLDFLNNFLSEWNEFSES